MILAWWTYEPPPCPVDDAPYTTCVSTDYAAEIAVPLGLQRPTVIVKRLRRPSVLDQAVLPAVQTTPPPPIQSTTETFTTKTYRGRKAKPKL